MSHGLQGYLTLSVSVNKFIDVQSRLGLKAGSRSPFYFFCVVFPIGIWALLFLGGALSGCVAPLAALGSGGTAAASSVGSTTVAIAVANPTTAASVASSVTTGKSPLEHAASAATKKECNFLNALGPKPICEEIPAPGMIDHSQHYLGPADMVQAPSK